VDLNPRDAFRDTADVASTLVASRGPEGGDPPLVTIAIPTYRRPDKLVEAIGSALGQAGSHRFEVIVVDNDADGDAPGAVLDRLPARPAVPVRYFVNARNIGMFGNWNRCIELARGPWMTILNDDDLLLPDYLSRVLAIVARRPEVDGLVCSKLPFDWATRRVQQPRWRVALKHLAFRWRFDRDRMLRVVPRRLFFGNEIDNGLGFLFKRELAVALGGYRAEEFPASDFFFYVRFCVRHGLFWLDEDLAYLGIGENESVKMATVEASLGLAQGFYETMAAHFVPRDWLRLVPQFTANQLEAYRRKFGMTFSAEERAAIEARMGFALPPPSFGRIRRFRLLHGGY
jgi:glycosyltransferase